MNEKIIVVVPEPKYPRGVLVRIKAGHFTAGLVIKNSIVIEAAPIVMYMKGWRAEQVEKYCKNKKWGVEVFTEPGAVVVV